MTWPQDAYVGQKVVCIDDGQPKSPFFWTKKILTKGNIYIIRAIGCKTAGNSLGIKLNGVSLNRDDPFNVRRFRPVQENEKGMEILERAKDPNFKIEPDKFNNVKASVKETV